MTGASWGGRADRRWVAAVLAEYGDTCHLCHHPGADSADHLRPVSTHPELRHVIANGRPAHHKRPCRVCGVRCNIVRKAKPLPGLAPHHDRAFFDAAGSSGSDSRPSLPPSQNNSAPERTEP